MRRITSIDGECVEARGLRYGTVPEGFTQDVQAERLQSGVAYSLSARGWTRKAPNVPFQAGGRFMFQGERWAKL